MAVRCFLPYHMLSLRHVAITAMTGNHTLENSRSNQPCRIHCLGPGMGVVSCIYFHPIIQQEVNNLWDLEQCSREVQGSGEGRKRAEGEK